MTHMYFSARAEGRISYGHLGRTNLFICNTLILAPSISLFCSLLLAYQRESFSVNAVRSSHGSVVDVLDLHQAILGSSPAVTRVNYVTGITASAAKMAPTHQKSQGTSKDIMCTKFSD